jgi:hypothetical protein
MTNKSSWKSPEIVFKKHLNKVQVIGGSNPPIPTNHLYLDAGGVANGIPGTPQSYYFYYILYSIIFLLMSPILQKQRQSWHSCRLWPR